MTIAMIAKADEPPSQRVLADRLGIERPSGAGGDGRDRGEEPRELNYREHSIIFF